MPRLFLQPPDPLHTPRGLPEGEYAAPPRSRDASVSPGRGGGAGGAVPPPLSPRPGGAAVSLPSVPSGVELFARGAAGAGPPGDEAAAGR